MFYYFLNVAVAAYILCSPLVLASSVHRVAAVVHQEPISYEDVLLRVKMILAFSGQPLSMDGIRNLYPQVLKTMVDEALQRKCVARYKIFISRRDVDQRIEEIEKSSNTPKGSLKVFLKERNIPFDVFRQQIETGLTWMQYVEMKYGSMVSVSSSAIQLFLKNWIKDHKETQYRVGEIVFYVSNAKELPSMLFHAQQVFSFLNQGASFVRLAQQFSKAPSHQQGGVLEWRSLSRFSKPVADALKKAAIGDIIGPMVLPSHSNPGQVVILAFLDKKDPNPKDQVPSSDVVSRILRSELLAHYAEKEMQMLRQRVHCKMFPLPFKSNGVSRRKKVSDETLDDGGEENNSNPRGKTAAPNKNTKNLEPAASFEEQGHSNIQTSISPKGSEESDSKTRSNVFPDNKGNGSGHVPSSF